MLILLRHGESEWNKLNQFTGLTDVGLTETGREEARQAGRALAAQGLVPDLAFTSVLSRAIETLEIAQGELGAEAIPVTRDPALNERDYGDLTGMNKDSARARFGEEQVHVWRRSYDVAPPGGESLKDVVARVMPCFDARIRPEIEAGRKVIVAAHGNSLRAIVKEIEGISEAEIPKLELATGQPRIYEPVAGGGFALRSDSPAEA